MVSVVPDDTDEESEIGFLFSYANDEDEVGAPHAVVVVELLRLLFSFSSSSIEKTRSLCSSSSMRLVVANVMGEEAVLVLLVVRLLTGCRGGIEDVEVAVVVVVGWRDILCNCWEIMDMED